MGWVPAFGTHRLFLNAKLKIKAAVTKISPIAPNKLSMDVTAMCV